MIVSIKIYHWFGDRLRLLFKTQAVFYALFLIYS